MEFMPQGDALVVTKPHRLARSTQELLSIHADLEKRGIGPRGPEHGTGYPERLQPYRKADPDGPRRGAEWERRMMLERQRAGLARAKGEGKH
jgi:DNA invertase Pin-like site-specific DNA recombinase